METVKEDDKPCRKIREPIHMIAAVEEFHALSLNNLSKLIRDAENDTIKWTKSDGSTFEINVEILARNLVVHLMAKYLESNRDEQLFRYMLRGLRLLHSLLNIADRHSKLDEVLLDDVHIGEQILHLTFFLSSILSRSEQKVHASRNMILLHSALVACNLYLLTAFISSQWNDVTHMLLAFPKVDFFMFDAFHAVRVVINFLQVKLSAQQTDTRMKSNVDDVHLLFQLGEASLQVLQSLCQQKLFREHLVKNEEICEDGVVLRLVQDIMKLPQCEDTYIMAVVYRLKSKVLSIMLFVCEADNSSFLAMASKTTRGLNLAKSTLFEVLEILKVMFCGDLKDHPRGLLQLHAMRLTEIFSDDSSFRSYVAMNLTEDLAKVFSQPQRDFVRTWCSFNREPAEEDTIMNFDSLSAAGQVLGVISASHFPRRTLNTCRAPNTPYAHQKSSLLVKILANLTYFDPNLCEEEQGLFINEFLQCLQKEVLNVPDGVAHGGGAERAATASRNLRSLFTHAGSLTPEYLNKDDVHILGLFTSQLEKLITSQRSNVQEVQNERLAMNLNVVQLDQLNFKVTVENQSNSVAREEQMTIVAEDSSAQNKRKRNKMNDMQIGIIESALLHEPDMQRKASSLQLWADKLSCHGSEVTPSQLKNWLNNRKAKIARGAAMDVHVASGGNDALNDKQVGSGPDPVSDSSKSPSDDYFDPSPSALLGTHQKDVTAPTNSFKLESGQYVMLIDEKGQEIGKGSIHLAMGVWFGRNLEELGLCVVDVTDLKVDKRTKLPHPCEATGTTFFQAEMILSRRRVLWDSSKLILIQ